MEFSRKKNFFAVFLFSLPFLLYFSFTPLPPQFFDGIDVVIKKSYTKNFIYTAPLGALSTAPATNSSLGLINPPTILKAIHVTSSSVGSQKYLDYLDNLFTNTHINAVVIDIKDNSGVISYPLQILNINELITYFHNKGIYVIGRIVVFEDPVLAKKRPAIAINSSWVDPAAPEVYDYNIEIAKDAIKRGFDEINFDYVRFPADDNKNPMTFPAWDQKTPKNIIIKNFYKKLREALPDTKISISLFGKATSSTDDLGIGQIWEDALPYFDYICPTLYSNQNINSEIESALSRNMVQEKIAKTPVVLAKTRPWLQDDSLNLEGLQKTMGENFNGYMLWKILLK